MATRTVEEGTPRHYPWYKERLQWKYLANQQRQLNTLTSHRWRFLSSSCSNDAKFQKKKPPLKLPLIDPDVSSLTCIKTPYDPDAVRLVKDPSQYSKTNPGQKARRDRIENIEKDLIEEYNRQRMSSDEDDVFPLPIDPFVRVTDTDTVSLSSDDKIDNDSDGDSQQQNSLPQDKIYRWPLLKSKEEKAEEELELARKRAVSPTQEAQVNSVTHELIEWSKNLGDEKEYIDEATIKRLFASDYEAKPVLTAPIHVIELKNIPHELRTDSRGHTGSSYRALSAVERLKLIESSPLSKSVRYKYGAWYLSPSLWKLRPWSEPLEDPKVVKKREEMETRMKNESLDAVLSETHGALAFRNFITNKYKEVHPEFKGLHVPAHKRN
ncbi:PREDICTED: protein FAM47E-like [Amphimedon queenslandica]|uniref:Uncharacterized protein n=1 Tax=Amphimedon queenslandica TaxID=400682 RepID=A0A1X7VNY6_AMPQE|nr:PREDICTED: protein FAM47E-like [Amphimedon queenslandica]|eukprot:XP_019860035.1 PREDICTED: protein FAM47E-like [Amphimedon queenslandica]